nr:hypothetical protein Iba_chr01cCG2770 [Ipomoea batatas]
MIGNLAGVDDSPRDKHSQLLKVGSGDGIGSHIGGKNILVEVNVIIGGTVPGAVMLGVSKKLKAETSSTPGHGVKHSA